jgi:hypothetical protein
MCTEFFLALIYFFTIVIVNYFLFRLVRNYLKNIFYLIKIKNILVKDPDNLLFQELYQLTKKEFKNSNFLISLKKIENKNDVLLIGNIYKYFSDNIDKGKNSKIEQNYYFRLLQAQYLSMEFNLKYRI